MCNVETNSSRHYAKHSGSLLGKNDKYLKTDDEPQLRM